jgi:predicted ArsR family transcriptional regulator
MKQMMLLRSYSQLKALSDPFRAKMIMRLMHKPQTGQQLAEYFNLSRAHVHYHLKELEKNGLVEMVRQEEKNGIMQKFYQSVARGFAPATELLPHVEEVGETLRQLFVQMLEKTQNRLIAAPAESFRQDTSNIDPSEWSTLGSVWEITATEDQFREFVKQIFELVSSLRQQSKIAQTDPNAKLYHISTFGFEVEDAMSETILDCED